MRILKGYSKRERKELEETKDNNFDNAIDLIRGNSFRLTMTIFLTLVILDT